MSAQVIPLAVCRMCGTFRTIRVGDARALTPSKNKPWPCFSCVVWAGSANPWSQPDPIPTEDEPPPGAA
jgi:hypothetical protein